MFVINHYYLLETHNTQVKTEHDYCQICGPIVIVHLGPTERRQNKGIPHVAYLHPPPPHPHPLRVALHRGACLGIS